MHTYSPRSLRADVHQGVSQPGPSQWTCSSRTTGRGGRCLRWSLVTECSHFPGRPGLHMTATGVKRAADFHYSSGLSEGWLPHTRASLLKRGSTSSRAQMYPWPGDTHLLCTGSKPDTRSETGNSRKGWLFLDRQNRRGNSSLPRPSGGETWGLHTERSAQSPRGAACLLDGWVRLAWLTTHCFLCE